MLTSLVTMRQILITHLTKSSGYELAHFIELINLWIESLLEFGFSKQEIKIQLHSICSSSNGFKNSDTIRTCLNFFLDDCEKLN